MPTLSAYAVRRQEQGKARATIGYELAILRRAFNLAVQGNVVPRRPPFPSLSVNNARRGFFEPAELEALLVHLKQELRGMLRFAYLTGWRIPSEVLTLQWDQVDLEAGVVRLEPGTTKNSDGRTFPLDVLPALVEVLRSQRAYTDVYDQVEGKPVPWVFHRAGRPIKDFREAWERACEKAKLARRIPHDFRRSAVRNLERAGVPRSVAMKLTGHKTEAVYRRYAIVSESDLREGVAKLARSMTTEQLQSEEI
jgi:integrase